MHLTPDQPDKNRPPPEAIRHIKNILDDMTIGRESLKRAIAQNLPVETIQKLKMALLYEERKLPGLNKIQGVCASCLPPAQQGQFLASVIKVQSEALEILFHD